VPAVTVQSDTCNSLQKITSRGAAETADCVNVGVFWNCGITKPENSCTRSIAYMFVH
jgi:hypothetical protein